jgi:alpha-1,3-mannosyltransferase
MACLCLSKRMHSIFLLRLFNDGPTILLTYVSILLFTKYYWRTGCFVFSMAVSCKMNVLLFAPGLLLLLLQSSRDLPTVVFRRLLPYCAVPQLVLGAPFLLSFPVSYLKKSFELDRVFFYKWTVNWRVRTRGCLLLDSPRQYTSVRFTKCVLSLFVVSLFLKFLSEEIFLSKQVAILLLGLHIGGLSVCAFAWLAKAKRETGQRLFLPKQLSPHYIVYTMLVSNFIGICFARTLHYQFYSWYFHSLPYMLWSAWSRSGGSGSMLLAMTLILVAIESSFLTFPTTPASSLVLQLSHLAILVQIRPPSVYQTEQEDNVAKEE